ncbi:MAG: hypothetical protein KBS99_05340 [Prevotellaceae bacterium]|nr:hypothetical protein [Candidatus Colivivens caballi]
MKKILFSFAALAVAFGFTACSNEDEVIENENSGKLIVTAFTEQGATRTALQGNDKEGYNVVWSEGDQFYVYKQTKQTSPFQRVEGPFNLISEADKTNGTFEKEGDALPDFITYNAFYGDFPEAFSLDYLSDFYPTEQTYSEGNIKGFPMMAMFSVKNGKINGPISFRNLNGILRLTVKGTDTVIKSIKVSAAELPTPITLDCGAGVELTSDGIDFNIAMLSGTFTGVEIALTDTEGKKCVKTFKGPNGLVVERSMITKAAFTASDFQLFNVGSKVTIGGNEGIVVDLNHDNAADVIVATMNVDATVANGPGCLGTKKTYDEACKAWSGWRLPTVDEFKTLCDVDYPTLGDLGEGVGTGALLWDFDEDAEIDLYLPLNDYEEEYPYDKYWTGTPGENDTEKCFYFAPELDWESGSYHDYSPVGYYYRSEEVPYKEEAAKDSEFLVRLFHDLP